MTLLKIENVRKQFSNHLALDDVSLTVPKQSIYGLLGPNGAGKTTLLRIINQITAPDSGTVYLDGKPLSPADLVNIGYLPEERGLYKKMKVGEQSVYLAQLKGLSKPEAIAGLKEWFTKFEVIDWWDKKVEELSKGMQQKIQFITTILHKPKLLIFDEPFSGFDPINTNLIKQEILGLRDQGATIIFSTHNMESVEELCDHITLLDQSQSILEGSVEKIRTEWAANEYLVDFEGKVEVKDNSIYNILSTEHANGNTKVHLKATVEKKVNTIVSDMLKAGDMVSFNPALPSMNEIFIRVVEANTNSS
ncbi:MAG: ATP-binding cassette domain-containing protein, partial [Bacteroidales bacterium]|nr:ATP-binding cassette domain-containing protein [Bacteroidales bacterium]